MNSRLSSPVVSVLRIFFALLTLAAVGVTLAATFKAGESVGNFFSFFTIQSNLFAAAMLLVTTWFTLTRRNTDRLAMFRGASSLYMVITGIVYVLLLRGADVSIDDSWANWVLHYIMPVVMLLDWILLPPARRIELKRALVWLAYPIIYAAYSLIRGSIADWYPYPFIDLRDNSELSVAIWIAVLLVAASLLTMLLVRIANRPNRHA